MVVAAVYLFATCYTAGFTVEAINESTEIIGGGLTNNTRISPASLSYDPFFQGPARGKKQVAEANMTQRAGRLFQNKWNEEGSCFLHFVTIFLAFFIMLGLTAFVICYSYG